MRKYILIPALLLWTFSSFAQTPVKLAVIGSSTSACYGFAGGITDANCYINRVVTYYNANGYSVNLFNLALSGANVYQGMPNGYPSITVNGNTYTVDAARNITMALSFNPDVIIVNYPSNLYDVANVHDILSYFRIIYQTATNAGKKCFITTTQPRAYDVIGRAHLIELKDSILLQYGFNAINFWDNLAQPDGYIIPQYNQGDGTHLTSAAHDTLSLRVIAKNIFSSGCGNRSVKTGAWNDPTTWEKGQVPASCDSITIQAGHTITVNSSATISSLRIMNTAAIAISGAGTTIEVGAAGTGNSNMIVDGSLSISSGKLLIRGRLEQKTGSSFSLTGGSIVIDGNTGNSSTSIADGVSLFKINAASSFSFTGGTLQFIDPPLGANSVAINCPFDFGTSSTLHFGDGISITPSNNINGFGGPGMPANIGNLILDAVIKTDNRIFKNTTPLHITGSLEVRSGDLREGAGIVVGGL